MAGSLGQVIVTEDDLSRRPQQRARPALSSLRRAITREVQYGFQVLTDVAGRIGLLLNPDLSTIPQTRTVVAALVGLGIFFIVGGFAIKQPTKTWEIVAFVVAATIEATIAGLALADYQQRGWQTHPSNSSELMAT